jgi:hypothetical protein
LRVSRGTYLLALMLACIALLVGCAGTIVADVATPSASAAPKAAMPTDLLLLRVSGPPESHAAPFSARSDQPGKVRQLFTTMLALPTYVGGGCPIDRGGGYFLTFLDHDNIVAQAFIPAGGCAHIAMSKPYGCHKAPASVIQQLADTLGVPTDKIGFAGAFYDTAPPGSPTAPAVPTPPVLPMESCH